MPTLHTFVATLLLGALLLSGVIGSAQAEGWTTGAPMPAERSEVAVAEVDGTIYVVGGFSGATELEIYDPAADRWRRGAAVPRALHHAAAVGLNGRLFVVGGYVDGWTPVASLYEYDPASDRWRALAPMPTPRCAWAAAVLAIPSVRTTAVVNPGDWRRPRTAYPTFWRMRSIQSIPLMRRTSSRT